jgi:uncharacterized membrane protein HdeD (DUF308 family)
MLRILVDFWWIFGLRGLIALLFGIFAITYWPFLAMGLFIGLFGLFAFIDGLASIIAALLKRDAKYWWVVMLNGITGILLGLLITFFFATLTPDALLSFIALWAILSGILKIIQAVRLHREIKRMGWVPGLIGAVSMLFGLILLVWPIEKGPTVYWLFGIFAALFGILLIIMSLKVRKTEYQPE